MTAPYSSAAAEYIKGSLEHICTVTVDPLTGPSFELPLEDIKVTMSEDWSPAIQADITAPMLALDQLEDLDPRTGCRIQVYAGYRYPSGVVDVQLLADLGVRYVEPVWPDNQVTIQASSDEARAMDRMRVEANVGPFVFAGINECVQYFADYAVYPETAELHTDFTDSYGAGAVAGLEVDAGTPMWAPIEDAAARAGVWVYCTPSRKWRVSGRPSGAGTVRHVLEDGKAGTVITASAPLDRTQWANQVVVEYAWTDAAGAQQKVYGRAAITSGPFSVNTAGYRSDKKTYDRPATQAQANAAATSRVNNLVSRGKGPTFEAHAAYWLRPGQTIQGKTPGAALENYLLKSVTFQPLTGRMSVQTRQPVDATITTGA